MKNIIILLALVSLASCSNDEQPIDCCGKVIEVTAVSSTQWKYKVKNDCTNEVHEYESRHEILNVGDRTCN